MAWSEWPARSCSSASRSNSRVSPGVFSTALASAVRAPSRSPLCSRTSANCSRNSRRAGSGNRPPPSLSVARSTISGVSLSPAAREALRILRTASVSSGSRPQICRKIAIARACAPMPLSALASGARPSAGESRAKESSQVGNSPAGAVAARSTQSCWRMSRARFAAWSPWSCTSASSASAFPRNTRRDSPASTPRVAPPSRARSAIAAFPTSPPHRTACPTAPASRSADRGRPPRPSRLPRGPCKSAPASDACKGCALCVAR